MLAFVTTREKRYDDNMEAMLECVRISHSNTWSKDPMMQLKVTALLSPELCVRQINVQMFSNLFGHNLSGKCS